MATRNSEVKVDIKSDTTGFNIDPAKKSLRDLQKDSAAAKAELAKLQAEFQSSRNAAVQAGAAYDKSIGNEFKKKISDARTEVSKLNAELAQGVASGVKAGGSGFGGISESSLGSIRLAIGAASLAATAATATFTSFVNKSIELADQLGDVGDAIGVPAARLLDLQGSFVLAGGSIDSAQKLLLKFNENIGKAASGSQEQIDAFTKLGVRITDNNGKLRETEAVYKDAVVAIQGIEDPALRAAKAVEIFGKQAREIDFTKVSTAFDGVDLTNQIKQLSEAKDAADVFGNSMNKLSIIIGSEFAKVFKDWYDAGRTFIDKLSNDILALGGTYEVLAARMKAGFYAIVAAATGEGSKVNEWAKKNLEDLRTTVNQSRAVFNQVKQENIRQDAERTAQERKNSAKGGFGTSKVKPTKVEPPAKIEKLRADLANKESEAQKQSLNEFKFISEEYKRLYAENLVSIEAYYAQQEALVQKQRADDNAAFLARQAQLEAEKARLEAGVLEGKADQAEVLKVEEALQKAITENQAKQLGYVTQLRSLQDAQVKDLQKYEASMRNISAEYLSQAGLAASAESVELRRLAIAEKYAAQIRQATAQGNEEALRRIENLKQFEQATAQLAARQAELQQTMVGNDVQQLDIQRQQQQGLISNIEAEQRLLELKRQQTEAQIAFNEAAIATGQIDGLNLSPQKLTELQNATAKLKVEMQGLQPVVQTFGDQFQTLFQDRIGNALGDVLTRTKSFKDAFKSLLIGIAQDIIRSNINKALAGLFSAGFGGGANGASGLGTGVSGFGSAFADGGSVRGPGTSTSDSIPARLSDGEFVVKASSVQKYGVDFMHAINQGIAPAVRAFKNGGAVARQPVVPQRFATGGMVSPASSSDVNIQVINNSSQPVTAKQEKDPRTGLVSLILEDLNRGGPISRGINGITGTGRKPAY